MSSSAALESKGAQLARSLEKQKVALSSIHSNVQRTEKELVARREQFQTEVRRALRALDSKREVVRTHTENEREKTENLSNSLRDRLRAVDLRYGHNVRTTPPTAETKSSPPHNADYHMQLLSQLKKDVRAAESSLMTQKASARELSRSVHKTEEQISIVQSMVEKLKSSVRVKKESVSHEEAISMALVRHAVSRTLSIQSSDASGGSASEGEGRKARALMSSSVRGSIGEGTRSERAFGGEEDDSFHDVAGVLSGSGKGSPTIAGTATLSVAEKVSSVESSRSFSSIEGIGVSRNGDATALSLQCDVARVGGVQMVLATKDCGGISVNMQVNDATMIPTLLREKSALLSKLRDAGHNVDGISVSVGARMKQSESLQSYSKKRPLASTTSTGGDDELAVS